MEAGDVVLKRIFRKKGDAEQELTVEDLITLERYDEAAERLRARVKAVKQDLHAHLKLAEVYLALREVTKALDEYVFVADSYADDGFFDKAIALLGKAAKVAPGDDTLPRRIERYRRLKRLEHRRRLAIEGLRSNRSTVAQSAGNSALEVELLWNKIAKSHLVEELSGEQLKKLFSVMEMRRIIEGQTVAKAGSPERMMLLVVNGVIDASCELNGQRTTVRSFSTGDVIGESALLEGKPWPADYEVVESGTVFRLSRSGFEQAMVGNEDPRGFISTLRQQQNDRDVAASLQRLKSGG
ncbi:MAG: cyclic nucleotide-binding domain-containing protein [Acidobacteria bacterium]|nr:MAG: cyclic nucleotide-binding domain-containing protein [Acidobacteriota bacterium]